MERPFLKGERVFLRPLIEADVEGPYVDWFNDEDVCRGNAHHIFPYTMEAARAYIRRATKSRDAMILAIVLIDDERHIGNIALQKIHPFFRSAEFSIVIGDKTTWGKGYGKEAGRLICDHGFAVLNLNRIGCGTFEDNVAMRQLASYLGMREEGRRRQAVYKLGRYIDVVEYGVLKHEYEVRWHDR